MLNNLEIRMAAKEAGVRLYQIAAVYGVNDGNFSRKLRWELPEAEKAKIMQIIQALSVGKEEERGAADAEAQI